MFRALVGVVERSGVSRDRFLVAAGIDPQLIEDGRMRLTMEAYQRAIDAAIAVSGDPAFGLHMGEQATSAMFDVIGHLAEHAETLRQSLQIATRYSRLMAEGHEPELCETGELAAFRLPTMRGDFAPIRLTAEFAMSALWNMLPRFAGPGTRPNRVAFAYRAPAYVAEYRRLFGDAAHFDQAFTEIEFPRMWLDRSHLYRSPDIFTLLETQAERALGRLERDAPLVERVQEALATAGPRPATMEAVARELGMSARSLRRQLSTEGVNFGQLVERSRIVAAKRMLQDPRTTIQEAAYAMGFAAPAAFHRAFKRWTGMTPKQYRASF